VVVVSANESIKVVASRLPTGIGDADIGNANSGDAKIVDADMAMTSSCVLTKSQG
jgi:hypothetical protein